MKGDADANLLLLLDTLRRRGYVFVTPTPASHARVLARADRKHARSLTDVLGWSLPFAPQLLDREIYDLLERADAIEAIDGGLLRSRIRVSSLLGDLYLHSAYPTVGRDAVFFGPDSYRFARLIQEELLHEPAGPRAQIVDIGTGAGVGAIVAARQTGAGTATGIDVNPLALRMAAVNARAAGIALNLVLGENLDGVAGDIDLALANPPYIIDQDRRRYRDGGAMLGGELSLRMAESAVTRLAPGGRLILYTGSAIVGEEDVLGAALADLADRAGCSLRYSEIDPDVFGEELEGSAYRDVDRIALVAAIIAAPG